MDVLILYLVLAIIGYFLGASLVKRGIVLKGTGAIQTIAVVVLVFVMGSRIGADESIFRSLGTIGVMALAMTAFILTGGLAAVFFGRKLLGFDAKGQMTDRRKEQTAAQPASTLSQAIQPANGLSPAAEESSQPPQKEKTDYTMLLCIFIPVILGILAGFFVLPQGFIDLSGTIIVVGLCIVLFFVGHDLGVEGTIIKNFMQAGWRVMMFPFLNMAGTYLGAIAAALILPIALKDALCVGSGFGWYTLAPAMLADYSMEISAISFLHNVMREFFGILLVPFIARKIGYIETTAIPGSCAMDVCLPIIVRATNGNIAVYSLISGGVLSAAVPLMVSLMMSL